VLLAACGDVDVEAPDHAGFQVCSASVARIRSRCTTLLGWLRHAHLMITIDVCLAVVALDSVVQSLEDVAVGIPEVFRGGSLGIASCIGGEYAQLLRQWISAGSGGNRAQMHAYSLGLLEDRHLGVFGTLALPLGSEHSLEAHRLVLLALARIFVPYSAT